MTPYRLNLELTERSRAKAEVSLYTGWFAERFAREERLSGPQHYVEEFLGRGLNPELAREQAEAEAMRWAAGWGLEVVEIGEDE